jgi:hemerythrin-like domain-containing protein
MTVLDSLKNDHKLVRRYLDNLTLSYDFLVEGEKVPSSVFKNSLEFTNKFLNKYHHQREEYILFVELAAKKKGSIDPEIVALRDQHERGRNLISQIKDAMRGYEKDDKDATRQLTQNIDFYVSLMREHIHKEDHEFFPMVDQEFSADDLKEIEAEYKKFDKKMGPDFLRNTATILETIEADLKEKFGAEYRDRREKLVDGRGHE